MTIELETNLTEDFGFRLVKSIPLVKPFTEESLPLGCINLLAWDNYGGHFAVADGEKIITGSTEELNKVLLKGEKEDNFQDLSDLESSVVIEKKGVSFLCYTADYSQLIASLGSDLYILEKSDLKSLVHLNADVISLKTSPHNSNVLSLLDASNNLYLLDIKNLSSNEILGQVVSFDWSHTEDQLLIANVDQSVKTIDTSGSIISNLETPAIDEDENGDFKINTVNCISDEDYFVFYTNEENDSIQFLVNITSSSIREIKDILPSISDFPRKANYYPVMLSNWSSNFDNLVFVTSSLSSDILSLTTSNLIEQLNDTDRAQLPLDEDTYIDSVPLGLCIDLTNNERITTEISKSIEDESVLPLPRLILLTHDGQLCVWNIFDIDGIKHNKLTPLQELRATALVNKTPNTTTTIAEKDGKDDKELNTSERKEDKIINPFATQSDNPFRLKSGSADKPSGFASFGSSDNVFGTTGRSIFGSITSGSATGAADKSGSGSPQKEGSTTFGNFSTDFSKRLEEGKSNKSESPFATLSMLQPVLSDDDTDNDITDGLDSSSDAEELSSVKEPLKSLNVANLSSGPTTFGNGPTTFGNGPTTFGNGPTTFGSGPTTFGSTTFGNTAFGSGTTTFGQSIFGKAETPSTDDTIKDKKTTFGSFNNDQGTSSSNFGGFANQKSSPFGTLGKNNSSPFASIGNSVTERKSPFQNLDQKNDKDSLQDDGNTERLEEKEEERVNTNQTNTPHLKGEEEVENILKNKDTSHSSSESFAIVDLPKPSFKNLEESNKLATPFTELENDIPSSPVVNDVEEDEEDSLRTPLKDDLGSEPEGAEKELEAGAKELLKLKDTDNPLGEEAKDDEAHEKAAELEEYSDHERLSALRTKLLSMETAEVIKNPTSIEKAREDRQPEESIEDEEIGKRHTEENDEFPSQEDEEKVTTFKELIGMIKKFKGEDIGKITEEEKKETLSKLVMALNIDEGTIASALLSKSDSDAKEVMISLLSETSDKEMLSNMVETVSDISEGVQTQEKGTSDVSIQAFENDELYVSRLNEPKSLPRYITIGNIEYPDNSGTGIIESKIQELICFVDSHFEILNKNINNIGEFVVDHILEEEDDELWHTEVSLAFPTYWRLCEADTINMFLEDKQNEVKDLVLEIEKLKARTDDVVGNVENSTERIKEISKTLASVERFKNGLSLLKLKQLSFPNRSIRSEITKKLIKYEEFFKTFEIKLLVFKLILKITRSDEKDDGKNAAIWDLLISQLNALIRSHYSSIKELKADLDSIPKEKRTESLTAPFTLNKELIPLKVNNLQNSTFSKLQIGELLRSRKLDSSTKNAFLV